MVCRLPNDTLSSRSSAPFTKSATLDKIGLGDWAVTAAIQGFYEPDNTEHKR